jgi:signal transduction histidine kinase
VNRPDWLPHSSARVRLALAYAGTFAAGGVVLLAITYVLLAHNLRAQGTPQAATPASSLVNLCSKAAGTPAMTPDLARQCASAFNRGMVSAADAQRATTLRHLVSYSSVSLAVLLAAATLGGWLLAGRVLRPVRRIAEAARSASEHNLSEVRLNMTGPRDELRDLADTFDVMVDRLDRAFAAQRQFIANASHELRTPLAAARTSVDVILGKKDPSPADLDRLAADVRDEIGASQRILDALLTLAQADSLPPAREAVDVRRLFDTALDAVDVGDLTVIDDVDRSTVQGDPILLQQMVQNLVQNAARYNVPHGVIRVGSEVSGGEVRLTVANTGPVVPPEGVEALFEPFSRLDDRLGSGSGLGLTLVRSIVSAHGGTIRTDAPPTGGLSHCVVLPTGTARPADPLHMPPDATALGVRSEP